MIPVQFRWITPDDPLYGEERHLRWEVLRKPIGKPAGSEVTEHEHDGRHVVGVDPRGEVVCCAMLVPVAGADDTQRIAQVAVRETLQRRGMGRNLINIVEDEARRTGVTRLVLNGRVNAQGFWRSLGYVPEGDVFEIVGIPHTRMSKPLEP